MGSPRLAALSDSVPQASPKRCRPKRSFPLAPAGQGVGRGPRCVRSLSTHGLPCPGPGLRPEAVAPHGPAAGCSPDPDHWMLLQVKAQDGPSTEWPVGALGTLSGALGTLTLFLDHQQVHLHLGSSLSTWAAAATRWPGGVWAQWGVGPGGTSRWGSAHGTRLSARRCSAGRREDRQACRGRWALRGLGLGPGRQSRAGTGGDIVSWPLCPGLFCPLGLPQGTEGFLGQGSQKICRHSPWRPCSGQ